jgi:hypothetical protein
MKNALATALEPEMPAEEAQQETDDVAGDPATDPPAQDQQTEQTQEQKPDDKKTVVPHAALHEERERRKEIQKAFEEEKRQNAIFRDTMSRRMQELFQASQQSRQQQQPQFRDPNADPDPVAALAHNQQLTVQQLAQIQHDRQQQDQRARQADYEQRVISWAQTQAEEYRQANPDFDDAYNHLRMVRVQELQAMGLPVEQIKQTLYNDEMWVYHHAAQARKNPAEIAHNMAKASGWKPKANEQAGEQKIDALQKGAGAAKTLGNGGGEAGLPTLEQIAAMSEDDFAALKAKFAKQGKDLMAMVQS